MDQSASTYQGLVTVAARSMGTKSITDKSYILQDESVIKHTKYVYVNSTSSVYVILNTEHGTTPYSRYKYVVVVVV
jgi:hypothetical protein